MKKLLTKDIELLKTVIEKDLIYLSLKEEVNDLYLIIKQKYEKLLIEVDEVKLYATLTMLNKYDISLVKSLIDNCEQTIYDDGNNKLLEELNNKFLEIENFLDNLNKLEKTEYLYEVYKKHYDKISQEYKRNYNEYINYHRQEIVNFLTKNYIPNLALITDIDLLRSICLTNLNKKFNNLMKYFDIINQNLKEINKKEQLIENYDFCDDLTAEVLPLLNDFKVLYKHTKKEYREKIITVSDDILELQKCYFNKLKEFLDKLMEIDNFLKLKKDEKENKGKKEEYLVYLDTNPFIISFAKLVLIKQFLKKYPDLELEQKLYETYYKIMKYSYIWENSNILEKVLNLLNEEEKVKIKKIYYHDLLENKFKLQDIDKKTLNYLFDEFSRHTLSIAFRIIVDYNSLKEEYNKIKSCRGNCESKNVIPNLRYYQKYFVGNQMIFKVSEQSNNENAEKTLFFGNQEEEISDKQLTKCETVNTEMLDYYMVDTTGKVKTFQLPSNCEIIDYIEENIIHCKVVDISSNIKIHAMFGGYFYSKIITYYGYNIETNEIIYKYSLPANLYDKKYSIAGQYLIYKKEIANRFSKNNDYIIEVIDMKKGEVIKDFNTGFTDEFLVNDSDTKRKYKTKVKKVYSFVEGNNNFLLELELHTHFNNKPMLRYVVVTNGFIRKDENSYMIRNNEELILKEENNPFILYRNKVIPKKNDQEYIYNYQLMQIDDELVYVKLLDNYDNLWEAFQNKRDFSINDEYYLRRIKSRVKKFQRDNAKYIKE